MIHRFNENVIVSNQYDQSKKSMSGNFEGPDKETRNYIDPTQINNSIGNNTTFIEQINDSIPFVPKSNIVGNSLLNNHQINPLPSNQIQLNIIPNNSIDAQNDDLMISVRNDKFMVHDIHSKEIGYFTIKYLAKYLGNYYDTKKQFLTEYQDSVYDNSKKIIKMLLFNQKYNGPVIDIRLREPSESGFMSDLDLLFRLNNELHKYSESALYTDLHPVILSNKIKIERHIKKFIFTMLNYTLKLINLVSPTVTDPLMKSKLLDCSTQMVYRINMFVQDQLGIINKKTLSLKNMMKSNIELKQKIESHLTHSNTQNIVKNTNNVQLENDIKKQMGLQPQIQQPINNKYVLTKHDIRSIFT